MAFRRISIGDLPSRRDGLEAFAQGFDILVEGLGDGNTAFQECVASSRSEIRLEGTDWSVGDYNFWNKYICVWMIILT